MSAELTVIVENTAGEPSLLAEHGLSVHLAVEGRSVLFDTGSTPAVLSGNAAGLSVDLSAMDTVVISHGHHDHTGGLPAVLTARAGVEVCAHPRAFDKRWSDRPGEPMREIGWRWTPEALNAHGARFVPVDQPHALTDEVIISGPVGGPQPEIDRFVVRDKGELRPDAFADELFLLLRGEKGWCVLTGCCHRGLANTLRTARFLTRGEPIATVMGGFHLGRADDEQLADAALALHEADPVEIYTGHCTGEAGASFLSRHFPGRVHALHSGLRLRL